MLMLFFPFKYNLLEEISGISTKAQTVFSKHRYDFVYCEMSVVIFWVFYALRRFVSAAEALICLLYSRAHPVL